MPVGEAAHTQSCARTERQNMQVVERDESGENTCPSRVKNARWASNPNDKLEKE